jgi:hypothetical protein
MGRACWAEREVANVTLSFSILKVDGKPAYTNKITSSSNPAGAAETTLKEAVAEGQAAMTGIPAAAQPFLRYLVSQVEAALDKAAGPDGHITMAHLAELQRQYFDQEHYPGVKEFVEAARQDSACVGY